MIKKLSLIFIITFLVQQSFAQSKTRADRYFEKGDYLNAAEHYELELEKEYRKKILENISIAYYNTFQYRNAYMYLKQLVNGRFIEKDKSYDNVYNFKLYQILSALGDYEAAIDYYKLYKENLSLSVNKVDAIAIVEEFKLKNPDYKIEKVQFNSDASDFGANKYGNSVLFVSDRDKKELFSKTYKWTHRPFLDIYATKVNEDNDTIGLVKPFNSIVNTKLHEGNFCFSKDGNTMFISKSYTNNGKTVFNDKDVNYIHLYKSIKIDGQWTEPKRLNFNLDGFSYQHPALSPDEKKLYFSSNINGGYGSFDIYYVDIKGENYGEPVNLGSSINTPNREHFPFISKEGNLFFASNGHLGLGMLDNFVSEWTNNKFSEPINLGFPINSQYDDFNLIYYNDNQGFFASNRNKIDDNIYKFLQVGEIFIREYINIFEIRDFETKEYIPNATTYLKSKKNKILYSNTLDSLAVFNINLVAGSYSLHADSEGYMSGDLNVNILEEQDQKHILYLKKLPLPTAEELLEAVITEKDIDKKLKEDDPKRFEMVTDIEGPPIIEKNGKLFFELEPIYFDFDMWNIRADSRKILDELAVKLERYPNIHLKISSHTDNRGTVRYNQILSERRAESTRNYLALEGYVNARRMKFEGFGELQPIVSCPLLDCTEDEHQLNRRSEFEIIEY